MMTSMITLYPLTLTCATLLVCTQGASIRSEYGVIEKNKLYQSGGGDFPQLVLPYMSLVQCAVFCVERGFTKWACNYKKGANEVTCEAHDVASGLLDSDVITSTGDSLVYKEGAYGAPPPPPGIDMYIVCDNIVSVWADGVAVVTEHTSPGPPTNRLPVAAKASIPVNTKLLAVKCQNLDDKSGLLAGFSTGLTTNTKVWKCAYPDVAGTVTTGWKDPGFDQSTWSSAYKITSNTGDDNWDKLVEIPEDAKWVWGDSSGWFGFSPTKKKLFCRVEDTDECVSSPCLFGGTCTNVFGSYECECVSGRSGVNCDG